VRRGGGRRGGAGRAQRRRRGRRGRRGRGGRGAWRWGRARAAGAGLIAAVAPSFPSSGALSMILNWPGLPPAPARSAPNTYRLPLNTHRPCHFSLLLALLTAGPNRPSRKPCARQRARAPGAPRSDRTSAPPLPPHAASVRQPPIRIEPHWRRCIPHGHLHAPAFGAPGCNLSPASHICNYPVPPPEDASTGVPLPPAGRHARGERARAREGYAARRRGAATAQLAWAAAAPRPQCNPSRAQAGPVAGCCWLAAVTHPATRP
jgi:hypothetical protein